MSESETNPDDKEIKEKKGNSGNNDKSKGENLFKVLDELLAHTNSSRRLFLIFIASALLFAPIALGLGGVLLGHPTYNIRHLEGMMGGYTANMPMNGAHLQLVSQNGTVIKDIPIQQMQQHPHGTGTIFLGISIFIIISIIFAGILLFIAIKEYRFFSKWNKRFIKYKSLNDKIDKELGED
ncbi:MAG TPA: hypothetical protein VEU72_05815 [Nitrosopumilaceae archaeon]|nr:hypothetical protein [Nitrosopumilaceae archaeon]